jgi:hypothetical protein
MRLEFRGRPALGAVAHRRPLVEPGVQLRRLRNPPPQAAVAAWRRRMTTHVDIREAALLTAPPTTAVDVPRRTDQRLAMALGRRGPKCRGTCRSRGTRCTSRLLRRGALASGEALGNTVVSSPPPESTTPEPGFHLTIHYPVNRRLSRTEQERAETTLAVRGRRGVRGIRARARDVPRARTRPSATRAARSQLGHVLLPRPARDPRTQAQAASDQRKRRRHRRLSDPAPRTRPSFPHPTGTSGSSVSCFYCDGTRVARQPADHPRRDRCYGMILSTSPTSGAVLKLAT